MKLAYWEHKELFIMGAICLLTIIIITGRWLYIRSLRIRNRIQMNYVFTNITHELLTPLTILAVSVEHLRSKQPDERKEYDLMDLNIQRTVRLLQQILETSKAQEGSLKLLVSNGDVMKYITETAQCIEPLMSRKQLEFSIHCTPESMMGWIDTDKLDKIIFNLLSNAVKYTPEKGRIILEASTNRHFDHVVIKVSDTGSGISKEKMKRLFTRFHDGDYRRYQTIGTGLGLSLTRDLVYLHKGSIHCKSIEGQGTTFIVDIPINKEAFSASQIDESHKIEVSTEFNSHKIEVSTEFNNILDSPFTSPSQFIGANGQPINGILPAGEIPPGTRTDGPTDDDAIKVLITEDNQELLMLMNYLLQSKYHVITATNGKEALNVIRHEKVDIIISDIMMPEMDGYELTREVKQDPEYGHLPIILLTAKTQQEDQEEALAAGADDYITKPFKLSDLILRINNIVENRQRILRTMPAGEDTEDIESAPPSQSEEFLQRAINCVNQHIDDPDYDRDTFAADMGASASSLYNKLRLLTGMNVSSFIRDIRLKTACRLAKENPHLRVSDIAYRVGFKDPKYFATSFKKEMGMQPKEYFDQLRSENAS